MTKDEKYLWAFTAAAIVFAAWATYKRAMSNL